jgi:hypothetical protein
MFISKGILEVNRRKATKNVLLVMSTLLYILSSSLYICAAPISVTGKVKNDLNESLKAAEVILFGIQDHLVSNQR